MSGWDFLGGSFLKKAVNTQFSFIYMSNYNWEWEGFVFSCTSWTGTKSQPCTGPSEPACVWSHWDALEMQWKSKKESMFPPKSNRFGTSLTPSFAIPRNSRPAQTWQTGRCWHRHVYRRSWSLHQCQHHQSSCVFVSEEMTASSLGFSSMDPFQILDKTVAQTKGKPRWYSRYLSHPSIQPSSHLNKLMLVSDYQASSSSQKVPCDAKELSHKSYWGVDSWDPCWKSWHLGCIPNPSWRMGQTTY